MASRARNRQIPIHRRSRSAHYLPCKTITETYMKEITTRPMQSQDDVSIPDIVYVLDDEFDRRPSPPLERKRGDYPIVRVETPSKPPSRINEYYKETVDYNETETYIGSRPQYPQEKYTRAFPDKRDSVKNPEKTNQHRQLPICHVIPPTPEKAKNCSGIGIPLNTEKRPNIPMYEEYIQHTNTYCPTPPPQHHKPKLDENHNPDTVPCDTSAPIPRPRPRTKSPCDRNLVYCPPDKAPRGNYRHIDSDSSDSTPSEKRYVFSHDVYVDSTTGRPYTPSDSDLKDSNCGRLKINVYFKPLKPQVVSTYSLDEIEIEKPNKTYCPPLPPPHSPSTVDTFCPPSHGMPQIRSFPSHTSLLRKQSEILTFPLEQSRNDVPRPASKCSVQTTNSRKTVDKSTVNELPRYEVARNPSQTSTKPSEYKNADRHPSFTNSIERNIPIHIEEEPINLDDIFPKMTMSPPQPRKSSSVHDIVLEKSSSSIHERKSITPQPESHHSYNKNPIYQYPHKPSLIDRTPSQKSYDKSPSSHHSHIEQQPNNIHDHEHHYQHKHQSSSHSSSPNQQYRTRPFEEVVHIKEKYERDETIRRFYPTTSV